MNSVRVPRSIDPALASTAQRAPTAARAVGALALLAGLGVVTGCSGATEPRRDGAAADGAADDATSPGADAASDAPPMPERDGGAYAPPRRYEVAVLDGYVVRDAARSRELPVRIRYPRGARGPLPLVVWSHGGDANANGHHLSAGWAIALATFGYVVINLAHAPVAWNSHCAPLGVPASECEGADVTREVSAGGTLPALQYHRPRDASAVLDDLAGIEARLGVQIDRMRVGAAGHSAGSQGVMSLAGARVDVSPSVHDMVSADTRFRAFMALSPQGVGYLGMTATSWDMIRAPVLVQTGLEDRTPGEEPAGRLDAFMRMPAGDKYQNYVDSPMATHGFFALADAPDPRGLTGAIATVGVAFFDAYLRDSAEARAWLQTNRVGPLTGGLSTVTTR